MIKLTKNIEISIVTLLLGILFIIIQLITGSNYPIFRDELYYIDCANHPAFGYVDQPPVSILILTVWKFIFGDSLISLRIIPAICGALLVILTSLLTKELGGNKFAQNFASVTVFSGLYFLAIGGFYSMNAFDSVFWALLFLILIKIIKTTPTPPYQGGDLNLPPLFKERGKGGEGNISAPRTQFTPYSLWPLFGLIAGLGLMNKISVGYLGLGIFIAILLTKNRVWLKQKNIWLGGLIALVIFSPYVIWNMFNDFATIEFIQNAQRYKIAALSPLDFLKEQVLLINPLSAPVWIAGLIALLFGFKRNGRNKEKDHYASKSEIENLKSEISKEGGFRVIGITYIVILVLLIIARSKPYYLAAAYPVLIAAGAAYFATLIPKLRFGNALLYVYSVLLLISTAVLSPMVIPVLPPDEAAAHIKRLGIMPSSGERNRQSSLPQILADRFGWEELTEKVAKIYSTLPEAEKKYTIVFGENYGEAGAINYYRKNRGGLPHCYSGHNSHYMWGPPVNDLVEDDSVTTIIVIGGDIENQRAVFNEVNVMDSTSSRFAMPFETGVPIYLCRGLKKPLKEIWKSVKFYI